MTAVKFFKMVGAALVALLVLGPVHAETQGVTDTEVLIGTDLDLSGPINFWGLPIKNGMEMAVDEINAAGGIHGRKLRLIVEDMAYDPKKAVLAVEKLLSRDRVFTVTASMGTVMTAATMPLVLKRGIAHVFPITPAEMFAIPFNRLKFAWFTPYYYDVRTSIKYLLESKKFTKVGVLYQDDDFGAEILKATQDQLQTAGMKPVSTASYKRGATDFSSQIARLKADGVELVVMATIVRETIGAMTAARNLGWKPAFLVSQAGYSVAIPALGKDVVDGLYAGVMTPIPYPDSPSPEVRDWLQRYKARYNQDGAVESAVGYSVLQTLALGLKNAGRDLTVDSFVAGLEQIRDYRNIFGSSPITLTPKDHLGARRSYVAQLKSGKWELLTKDLYYGE